MSLIHRLEPVLWILFSVGGAAAATLFPALLFGVAIAGPLGWFGEYATDYHRMYGLVAHPFGRLILCGVISLVLWHAAHHLRHLLLDLGLKRVEGLVCYGAYGLALVGTLVTLSVVSSL